MASIYFLAKQVFSPLYKSLFDGIKSMVDNLSLPPLLSSLPFLDPRLLKASHPWELDMPSLREESPLTYFFRCPSWTRHYISFLIWYQPSLLSIDFLNLHPFLGSGTMTHTFRVRGYEKLFIWRTSFHICSQGVFRGMKLSADFSLCLNVVLSLTSDVYWLFDYC